VFYKRILCETSPFLQLYESIALDLANEMREAIFNQTRCHASVGIASNILLARIATSKAKPNGVHSLLQHRKALLHLKDLPIRGLPGVGRSTSDKCAQLQLITCGDVQAGGERNTTVLTQLRKELGEKTGENLYDFCWGRDDRVLENKPRQSVGSDVNWGIRFVSNEQVEHFLKEYCAEVYDRLDKTMHTAGHVTVNVKKKMYEGEPGKFLGCGHCLDLSRSVAPGRVIISAEALFKCVSMLYKEIGLPPEEVRGVGVHLKKLQPRQTTGGAFFKATTGTTVSSAGDAVRVVNGGLALEGESKHNTETKVVAQKEPQSVFNIRNYFHTTAPPASASTDAALPSKCNFIDGVTASAAEEPPSGPVYEVSDTVAPCKGSVHQELTEGTGTQNSESDQDQVKDERFSETNRLVCAFSTSPPPGDEVVHVRTVAFSRNNNSGAVLSMDDVDLDVFMALPEDIQRELQRAFDNSSTNPIAAAGVSAGPRKATTTASRPPTLHKKSATVQSSSPASKRVKTSKSSTVGNKKIASQAKAGTKTSVARQPSITSIWGSK